jgi:PHD/YefM family antitoxin component YafN of YafNO toxin-antitoxin module
MRKVRLEQLPAEVQALFEDAKSQRILVTRNGVPFAVVTSVGNKDEEDLELEESPEFWQMIRERRREGASVSLEEVMAEIAAEEQRLKDKGDEPSAKTPAAGA